MQPQAPENVIAVDTAQEGSAVFLAHTSFEIYEGDGFVRFDDVKSNFQYIDEDGNPLDNEELVTGEDSFQEVALFLIMLKLF